MERTLHASTKRLPTRCLRAGLVVCLSVVCCAGLAAEQPSEVAVERLSGRTVEVIVEGGRLTLEAEGAPLAEVLRAIGAAGAFDVALRGALSEPIHRTFTHQPVEDVIRELTRAHSLVVIRDRPTLGGPRRLTGIRVTANRTQDLLEEAPTELGPAGPDGMPEENDIDPAARDEAYRKAVLDYIPPTRDDILFELTEVEAAARVAAVPKVGSLSPAEALEVISQVLSRDDDSAVRSRAIGALTRLDGPGARRLLRERALQDDDPGLRMQALNALASSRGERAVNVLAQALRQDREPEVRLSAIRSLRRVGGDWARRSLARAAHDLDAEIRRAAEQALAAWPRSPG